MQTMSLESPTPSWVERGTSSSAEARSESASHSMGAARLPYDARFNFSPITSKQQPTAAPPSARISSNPNPCLPCCSVLSLLGCRLPRNVCGGDNLELCVNAFFECAAGNSLGEAKTLSSDIDVL